MSKIVRIILVVASLAGILLLGYVILKPGPEAPAVEMLHASPVDELQSYLADRMDYGLNFSRILAEKRIERARSIARDNPEFAPLAREVVDTLSARLARQAKM